MSKKAWSLSYKRTIILAIVGFIAVLVMTLLMISAGLRCVDRDGCIREHCAGPEFKNRFDPQYVAILKKSIAGNPKCRIDLKGNKLIK